MYFLTRIAAANLPEDGVSAGDVAQGAAVGVAAASPFGGLIGRKKILHDPLQGAEGKNFRTLSELSRQARPGDVLVTSKPAGSLFKRFIDPIGGSQFYHAQPVVSRKNGAGQTLSAGDLSDWQYANPKDALHDAHSIPYSLNNAVNQYPDAVLLRPKTPFTREQLEQLKTSYGERAVRDYDNTQAMKTGLRELFVPKLDFLTKKRPEVQCEGNVCSTLPSMAHYEATGRRVIPGKASQDVFPTDFLRSQEYELVGSRVTPETAALQSKLRRRLAPWLLRGGLGAGLAATTYAATENPEPTAALLGAGAGVYAAGQRAKLPVDVPTLRDIADGFAGNFLGEGPATALRDPETRKELRAYLRRQGPRLAAGGLLGASLGYAGIRSARALYDRATAE